MTVSTLTVVPEAQPSGTAPCAEPTHPRAATEAPPSWYWRTTDARLQALVRAAQPDYADWLRHVQPAAGCTRPIRLAGTIATIEADTGRVLSTTDTAGMPDGVIYKPCGNRRAAVCPSCSQRYKRDAYQVSAPASSAAREYPSTSPLTRPCSPRSPRHPSARCTPAWCAGTPAATGVAATAGPNPAMPAATTRYARTGCRWRASPDTRRATGGSVRRCVWTATTMTPRSCGTCTPGSCGGVPPSPSIASCAGSLANGVSTRRRCGCRSAKPPRCNAGRSSTTTPSSASTAPTRPIRPSSCRRRPGSTPSTWSTRSNTPPPPSPSAATRTPTARTAGSSPGRADPHPGHHGGRQRRSHRRHGGRLPGQVRH